LLRLVHVQSAAVSPAVQPLSPTPGVASREYAWSYTQPYRNPFVVAIVFGVVALTILLFGIRNPRAMFYDESKVFIHGPSVVNPPQEKPPLGEFLLAQGIKAAGDNSFGWRIAGGICGALTVVAVFVWAYLLLQDLHLASLAAGLALFNHFLFVMSRIGMMDAYLMVFLIWSLAAFTASLVLQVSVGARRLLFCASGVLVGLAGACKWNAVDTLAVLVLVTFALYALDWLPSKRWNMLSRYVENVREIGLPFLIVGMIAVPVAAYSLTFWPLCRAVHRPFTVAELVTMHKSIWHFHTVNQWNPAITLAWYRWPLNLSPQRALSYLVGNPVVTFGGLAALGFCVFRLCKEIHLPEIMVSLLFAANYLQWVVTPEKGLFYYYYYPSVMMLGMAIAVALHRLPARVFGVRVSLLVLLAAVVIFVRCYPQMAHLEAPWDCALGCWS